MNQPTRLLALIAGFALLASGRCEACRHHSYSRSCQANMKTLAGAIEMYDLDNNTHLVGEHPRRLNSVDEQKLVTGGYLQYPLTDPGAGSGQSYVLFPEGPMVGCLAHGLVGRTGTAREQFMSAGITDPGFLAAALDEEPPEPPTPYPTDEVVLAAILALFNELSLVALATLGARTLARLGGWCNRLVVLFTAFESFGARRVFFRPALMGTFLLVMLTIVIGLAVLAGLALRGFRWLAPVLAPQLQMKGVRA